MSSEEKIVRLPIAQIRLDGGTQVREKVDEAVVEEYAERMKREKAEIECRLFDGSKRDAVLVALKANSAHGLRRSNADKIRAVTIVLADDEWSKKSTRWIAELCGVSRKFVEDVRTQVATVATSSLGGYSERLGRDGKRYLVGGNQKPPTDAKGGNAVTQALATGEAFDRCVARLKLVAEETERLATGPGGKYLAGILDELRQYIRRAANQLSAARPSARCHFCTGKGCDHCCQHGWLSACLQSRLT